MLCVCHDYLLETHNGYTKRICRSYQIPLVPIALFFLCGLVAARVFPESSIISGEAGSGPGIILPQLQQPEVSLPGSAL